MAFRSIRMQLATGLAAITVLTLGGFTTIHAVLHRGEVRRTAKTDALAVARGAASEVELQLARSLFRARETATALSVSPTSPSLASRYLRQILLEMPDVEAVGVVRGSAEAPDTEHSVYWGRDEAFEQRRLPATFVLERSGSAAHRAARSYQDGRCHSPVPISTFGGSRLLVPIICPIVADNQIRGVVEILQDSRTWLRTSLARHRSSQNATSLFVVTDQGHVVCASTPEGAEMDDTRSLIRGRLPQGQRDTTYEENEMLVTTVPLSPEESSRRWYVVSRTPMHVVLAPARTGMWMQILGNMASVALVLLLASLLATRLFRPLHGLVRQINRVTQGDLEVESLDVGDDEIGRIYRHLCALAGSLKKVSGVCQLVAKGDFNHSLEMRGPKDELAQAINEMGSMLRAASTQAEAIASGDYSTSVAPRSERDQLGKTLFAMTSRLRKMAEENREQNWVKNGLSELDDILRGDRALDDLLAEALACLVRHAGAQVGALYLATDEETLRLVRSHAFHRRKNMANTLAIGEGLVGQAAREKEPIVLTEVPEDYVSIQSSLGEAPARNVIVVPMVFHDEVKGVLELGSLEEFSPRCMEFLGLACDNLAVAAESAQSRERLQELLEQTQEQSEELQAQQEELRQANTELEDQTRILRESQQRLETQQEQLERANSELEESAEALRRERNQVRDRNAELQEARRQLEEKAQDLERTSKYKSEFLANMSHELRTPLNSLLILSKLLIDNKEGNLTEKQVDFARTIYNSGSDLLQLINDILDLSKIESGKMPVNLEDVRLREFAHGVEQNFRHVAEQRGLEMRIELDEGLPETIHSDGQRIGQIVKNLLSNAFKFTEQGGNVTLQIKRPEADDLPPHLSPDKSIAFSVRDTGIGIPEEKQQLIFEAFQQADGTTVRKFGGTGLGLSICRELATLLAGEIRLVSEQGEGSCFTVVLPETIGISEEEDEKSRESHEELVEAVSPRPVASAKLEEPPVADSMDTQTAESATGPQSDFVPDDRHNLERGDRSILIIEDDRDFARILLDLAHEKGFQALVAADGETGLHLADYYMPSAILLDLGLPGIDGMTVVSRLKDNLDTRHIPVHIISGMERSTDALRQGAVGFLRKPVSMDEADNAFQRIERIISRRMRNLLVVEDNETFRDSLVAMLSDEQVEVTAVATAKEALEALKERSFDCMVLDLTLPDMPGGELLERVRSGETPHHLPVIVFTGRDLTPEEQSLLDRYAERVIVKGDRSQERLLDETTLFLHQVECDLPPEKQRIIEMLHDKEAILRGRKTLLVDDDMRNVFALTSVLEGKGLQVQVAKNGREALEALEATPDMELVVMDIMMPEMDGYEAMRRIRKQERFRKLPIIALTAKAMKGDRAKCIEAGASDYLAKPVDTDKLLSMMRVWLYR